ncbi:conserved membrane hypothetical protein [Magnetospirillum sp. LM-5]|uniref:hypothetical protein n=1 Tax=Magnetospirillum sp. LM-5 TaxID=2681466 RepID=UPI0013828F16|nr:hypothetical protein [Magnetospirillum sp. LM-5]CAA7619374.1 conserved membrane hypothetical protein [Magnetospirillum sp. LM-5]
MSKAIPLLSGPMETVFAFFPDIGQAIGLLAVLAAAAALAVLGAALGGTTWRETDLAAGWGLGAALLTLVGGTFGWPLTGLAAGLAVAVAGGAWWLGRRSQPPVAPGAVLAVALVLPLLVVVAAMVPSQWDEFSQWLWNAAYLVEHDRVPRQGLAAHPGSFPAYPFGAALLPYLASRLAGGLVEQAGALGNVLLLASFGLVMARIMADSQGLSRPGPALVAAGLLLATLAGPSFVAKVALTAYADAGTAVLLALGAFLGWASIEALAAGRDGQARALAWKASLVLAGMVAFKQSNLVLLVLLGGAIAVAFLQETRIGRGAALGHLIVILALPVLVLMLWRSHVATHLPGAEFTVRPLAHWSLDLLPDILASMGHVALNKGGHFGSMAMVALLGARALWRRRPGPERLVAIAALVTLGYQAFLLFAYVAAFDRYEAAAAASYWRYNLHVGALLTLALVAWVAYRRHWRGRAWIGWLAVALVVAGPALLAPRIRFDREPPKPFLRHVAQQAAPALGAGDRVAVVDLTDSGQTWLAMRWSLRGSRARVDGLFNMADADAALVAARLAGYTHLIIRRATPAVESAVGIDMAAGQAMLLQRSHEGWIILKRWNGDKP